MPTFIADKLKNRSGPLDPSKKISIVIATPARKTASHKRITTMRFSSGVSVDLTMASRITLCVVVFNAR
jgi:hypothetical protein